MRRRTGCCARVTSGNATAALQREATKSRRLMSFPRAADYTRQVKICQNNSVHGSPRSPWGPRVEALHLSSKTSDVAFGQCGCRSTLLAVKQVWALNATGKRMLRGPGMIEASSDDRKGETGAAPVSISARPALPRELWMAETREGASALAGRMELFS